MSARPLFTAPGVRLDTVESRLLPPGHAHVRNLFLRALGVIFLVAFVSVLVQIDVLIGSRGLLPAHVYVDALRAHLGWIDAPTLFWFDCSDRILHAAAITGAVVSLGLLFNVAPLYCLLAAWALYLSFVTIGQTFFSFQWDNLLLESAFFAFFLAPAGVRPRAAPAPHPIAVFLMQWLLLRLLVESGAAKLLTGDPAWRNLTAMASYYETAPLPTWVGWYAAQLPVWAHKLTTALTLAIEIAVPWCMWGPRRWRPAVFAILVVMQGCILVTANYGFFNYLTIALCLFILDDGHLSAALRRCGRVLRLPPLRPHRPRRTAFVATAALLLVPLSVVPFLDFVPGAGGVYRRLLPVRAVLDSFRSVNAYHLFASMTLERREVLIEGSGDGMQWQSYEFRYKPGDPNRPPPFVAPYQPRVDFQLWFLLLAGPPRARYFETLVKHLFTDPPAVAPLFSRDPFPAAPPRYVRLAFYRYRFTDAVTRRRTGAWWQRTLLGYSQVLTAASFSRS